MQNNIRSIGQREQVPESFVEEWGSKWGCPAKDGNGEVIGCVTSIPNALEEEIAEYQFKKAILTFLPYQQKESSGSVVCVESSKKRSE